MVLDRHCTWAFVAVKPAWLLHRARKPVSPRLLLSFDYMSLDLRRDKPSFKPSNFLPNSLWVCAGLPLINHFPVSSRVSCPYLHPMLFPGFPKSDTVLLSPFWLLLCTSQSFVSFFGFYCTYSSLLLCHLVFY